MSCEHCHEWLGVENRHQKCAICGIVRMVECYHEYEIYEKFGPRKVSSDGYVHTTPWKTMCRKCRLCGNEEFAS